MGAYDAIVIGGGPGGYSAAERLGAAGMKTLLIERSALGGTCLNSGCIPTKTLLSSAKLYAHALGSGKFGVAAQGVSYDWAAMQAWKREVVEKLRGAVALAVRKLGVESFSGEARLLGPGRVEARGPGGEAVVHEARSVIVAAGSEAVWPPIPGARGNPKVVDSAAMLEIGEVPKRLCVIGGGVIGVEFAGLFSALGCQVEVIEMMDEILPFMDAEQAPVLRRAMKGVAFRLGCRVVSIEGSTVRYEAKGGGDAAFEADLVLMAAGRRPVVDGWGAEESGLDRSPKGVAVDDRMRTSLPGVWAVGDVTGRSLLAHAAYRMADVAAEDILAGGGPAGGGKSVMRYDAVPWAVYGLAEAAGVGMTEREALAAGIAARKAVLPLRVSSRFCAEEGFAAPGSVKVVADSADGRIIGVHVVGSYASEMIWGAAALIERGMRAEEAGELIFPHPTVSEAIRDACREL